MHSPPFSFQLQGDKARQEDAVLTRSDGRRVALAVADGLGGHEDGDLASRLLLEILDRQLAELGEIGDSKGDAKAQLTEFGDRLVRQFQAELPAAASAAHTTLALAIIEGGRLYAAHVGDSRVYHLSGGELWRSKDHSVVQMLCDDGEIEEHEMADHPEQGRLYQSISPGKQPRIRINQRTLNHGDWVLVCSDGFWEGVSPQELTDAARGQDAEVYARLAHEARARRAPDRDNISGAAHRYTGGGDS